VNSSRELLFSGFVVVFVTDCASPSPARVIRPVIAAPRTEPAPAPPTPPPAPPVATTLVVPEAPPDPHARLASLTEPGLNLVLITVDTLRWDLHYAGYPAEISPNLDRLAERSVVFERGYAMSSYTGRSVGPLLTGRYPTECPNDNSHFTRYHADNVMLAERLRDAGFVTLGASAHHYFRRSHGLPQGVDHWDMSAHPPDDTNGHVVDDVVTDNAIALLREHARGGQRFYLWVHYIDPHDGYLWHPDQPSFPRGPRHRYDGEVYFTDAQIGRLLAAVASLPHGARTAVVVTADHGELFREHGISHHGRELWENLVRVPWIVHVPGLAPRRVSTRRSHIDMVPTLLEILRVAPHEGLQGQSLAADLVGEDSPARPVLMDLPQGPQNTPRRALIEGDWKLIVHRGHRELYDLAHDPDELEDRSRSAPEELRRLSSTLQALTRDFQGEWHRGEYHAHHRAQPQPRRPHRHRRHRRHHRDD
jgi:arylsulfatase A-like enzyme